MSSRRDAIVRTFGRLLVDDHGQDLIEYALLTGAIGFAGAVAFQALGGTIHDAYVGWDTGVNGLWEVPNPQP
jgi:Flp pilus assembly pilin Flp